MILSCGTALAISGKTVEGKDFSTADPDHDSTLTKDEYLAVVEERFKAADPDNDGTLSASELSSRAGRSLSQLLR